jgi:hypothetical protein
MDINIKLINKIRKKKSENIKSKKIILKHDFFLDNYIEIVKIIKNSIHYNRYEIFNYCEFLRIVNDPLSDDNINDMKHVLMTYNDVKSIEFYELISNSETEKLLITNVLSTYNYLLNSLKLLNDKNICYYDLSTDNISFIMPNPNPIIKIIDLNLNIERLNEEYVQNIIKKTNSLNNIYKPIEVHVLFYLVENDINTLSYSSIEIIINKFIENLSVLDFVSEKYREEYYCSCVKFLNIFANKPKNEIIINILKYVDKWDNYSLSILYYHILDSFSILLKQEEFISKFMNILCENIHPDPSKRETLENTIVKYDNLFEESTEWKFCS